MLPAVLRMQDRQRCYPFHDMHAGGILCAVSEQQQEAATVAEDTAPFAAVALGLDLDLCVADLQPLNEPVVPGVCATLDCCQQWT